jgi:HK97 family phage major capsid protein
MYEDPCPHGSVTRAGCAECRASRPDRRTLLDDYVDQYRGQSRPVLDARRAEIITRTAELESYGRRSQAQAAELDGLIAERIAVDDAIHRGDVEIRRSEISRIQQLAADPANLEAGWDPGPAARERPGAPALVREPGTRIESAQEVIQRANPWRDPDRGPLAHESGAGLIARANTAIETLESRLTHDGAELLSTLLAERRDLPTASVQRSQDEIREGAAMIVALSSPHYESAMRHVFRNPDLFRTGLGAMVWSDDEREAVHAVMNNTIVRAAFAETSGAAGAFALPLQLDPVITLINAGVASPHRSLARNELGTSNVWEGITSLGSTANVVAEGVAVTDNTPVLAQLAITPAKIMTWIFGSFEVMDDTALSSQVPALFDDARSRLEGQLFATGTGTAQPFGSVVRAATDSTATVLTAALIYGLHQGLPPRFRNGGSPAWACHVNILNACRQIPAFAGAVNSIVNDDGDTPRMLGLPVYEASAMDSAQTAAKKTLLLGDWKSYVIVDRLPSVTLAEPLVQSQATALPTGQRGWLNYSRVGADTTTGAAAFGSNAFVVHLD